MLLRGTDVLPVEQARHHLTLLHPTPELAGSHSSQASPFMKWVRALDLHMHACLSNAYRTWDGLMR